MRLDILPTGYIYPPEYRQVRDLLRRRRQLVRHASTQALSIQNQIWRSLGYKQTCNAIRRKGFVLPFEKDGYLYHSANSNLVLMRTLDTQIKLVEQQFLEGVSLKNEYRLLTSVTGIGPILGLTIILEQAIFSVLTRQGNPRLIAAA